MKLNINSEAAVGSGLKKVSDFKMDMNSKAARILSDTLYKDKHGSIVRELCSNAYDAHKESGKEDVPFKVSLPDRFTPMLTIRDYGLGISPEDIDTVYSTYFASTKDQSNDSVGAYGLGSKTPFSLTDSFMVTSIHKGVKRVYNAFMNEGKPSISQFGDDEQTDEPDGLEVSITVQEKDIGPFRDAVLKQLRFFPVKPEINGNIQWPEITETLLEVDGFTYFKHDSELLRGFFIKTGPVAYPVDFEVLFSHYQNIGESVPELLRFMQRIANTRSYGYGYSRDNDKGAVIDMPIGTVEVTPSREALSYSDFTLHNIVTVIEQIRSKMFDTVRDRLHEKYDESYTAFIEYFKNLDSMMLDSIDDDYIENNFDPFIVNRGELSIKLSEKFCPFIRKDYKRHYKGTPELNISRNVGFNWKDSPHNMTTNSKGESVPVPFEDTKLHRHALSFVTASDIPIYIKDESYAFAKRCYEDCDHGNFWLLDLRGTGSNKEFYDYLIQFAPDRVKLVSQTEKVKTHGTGGHSTTGGRTRQWFYLKNFSRTNYNRNVLFNKTLYTLSTPDEYDLTPDDLENDYGKNEVVFFTTFNNKLDEPVYGAESMHMVLNYLMEVNDKTVIAVPRGKAKKFSKLNCAIHVDDFLKQNKDEIIDLIESELKMFMVEAYNDKVKRTFTFRGKIFNVAEDDDDWHGAVNIDQSDWSNDSTHALLFNVDSHALDHILFKMDRTDIYKRFEQLKDEWTKVDSMEQAEAFLKLHNLSFVSFVDKVKEIKAMFLSSKNRKTFMKKMLEDRFGFSYDVDVVDPFSDSGANLLSLTDIADEIIDQFA